jgi:uncharacterized protein YbbK (DUF523 family)
MAKIDGEKLRLGVSSCLLGEPVRYDGGHKRDAFLVDTLGLFVEWVAVCPEMEIGLGASRSTLRLVGDAAAPRLVMTGSSRDVTASMRRFALAKIAELERLDLDGYVLKRASPSGGLHEVAVDRDGIHPGGLGRGLFADTLVRRLPICRWKRRNGSPIRPSVRASSSGCVPRGAGAPSWPGARGGVT